mgnify:FL=1
MKNVDTILQSYMEDNNKWNEPERSYHCNVRLQPHKHKRCSTQKSLNLTHWLLSTLPRVLCFIDLPYISIPFKRFQNHYIRNESKIDVNSH